MSHHFVHSPARTLNSLQLHGRRPGIDRKTARSAPEGNSQFWLDGPLGACGADSSRQSPVKDFRYLPWVRHEGPSWQRVRWMWRAFVVWLDAEHTPSAGSLGNQHNVLRHGQDASVCPRLPVSAEVPRRKADREDNYCIRVCQGYYDCASAPFSKYQLLSQDAPIRI